MALTKQDLQAIESLMNKNFVDMTERMDSRFEVVDKKFAAVDAKLVDMTTHMDARFAAFDAKLVDMTARTDIKFREVYIRIEDTESTIVKAVERNPFAFERLLLLPQLEKRVVGLEIEVGVIKNVIRDSTKKP